MDHLVFLQNMTLEEYEKVCFEKRKALESLRKTEQRTVTLDKDFESMQLVEKKKDDSLVIKPVGKLVCSLFFFFFIGFMLYLNGFMLLF